MTFFSDLNELDPLGVRFNTNKSSSWRNADGQQVEKEGLLRQYEFFLTRLRGQGSARMLELGAGPDENIGASVRMWQRYFPPQTEIHVADIKPSAKALESEGFHVHVGDLGQPEVLNRLARQRWDFVIDDASHFWLHQIMAFRVLFPALRNGGIFICEDLCTSFGEMRTTYSQGFDMRDAVQYFMALSRLVCGRGSPELVLEHYALSEHDLRIAKHIHMVSWMNNSVIIVKR